MKKNKKINAKNLAKRSVPKPLSPVWLQTARSPAYHVRIKLEIAELAFRNRGSERKRARLATLSVYITELGPGPARRSEAEGSEVAVPLLTHTACFWAGDILGVSTKHTLQKKRKKKSHEGISVLKVKEHIVSYMSKCPGDISKYSYAAESRSFPYTPRCF